MNAYSYEGVLCSEEVVAINQKFDFSEVLGDDLTGNIPWGKVILNALPAATIWLL